MLAFSIDAIDPGPGLKPVLFFQLKMQLDSPSKTRPDASLKEKFFFYPTTFSNLVRHLSLILAGFFTDNMSALLIDIF